MATVTVAKLISDWELLHTALQPHLTDLPFLKDQATALEGLIAFWVLFTALLCFILGTFEHITLLRDRKGRGKLIKQWRFVFVPPRGGQRTPPPRPGTAERL